MKRPIITVKRPILAVIIILVVLIISFLIVYFTIINKEETVRTLATVQPLNSADEVEAVALVKNNIVKITNSINQNSIIGTGFFHESGYLVTNSHVVDIKGDILITYADGSTDIAKLVANDIISDVALLKVDSPKALAMLFGSTMSLKEPETVISVGYAFNLAGKATVTKGAFSARRSMGGIEFLQSDAAVNPGSSGSPMIDTRGYLIGMNSLSNENATINLSISAESLATIIDKLLDSMEVTYIDGSRPENCLSNILFEIGFEISDIYNENQYLTNTEETADSGAAGSATSSPTATETPVPATVSSAPTETSTTTSTASASSDKSVPDGCLHYNDYLDYISGMSEANTKAEVLSKGFGYEAYHIYYPNRSKTGLMSTGASGLSFVNSDGETYFEGDGERYIEIGVGKFIFYYNVSSAAEAEIDPEQIRKLQGQTEGAAISAILDMGLTYNVNYFYVDESDGNIGIVYDISFDTSKEYLPRGSKVELYVYKVAEVEETPPEETPPEETPPEETPPEETPPES